MRVILGLLSVFKKAIPTGISICAAVLVWFLEELIRFLLSLLEKYIIEKTTNWREHFPVKEINCTLEFVPPLE